MRTVARYICLPLMMGLTAGAGCGSDDVVQAQDPEVITTITLVATPSAGGQPVLASVDDADGDGGNPPVVTGLMLPPGAFDLTVKFENRLETQPEDITQEVRDEGAEHQLFFTGDAVNGPASERPGAPLTHVYADMDSNGLPIGLTNKVTAVAGSGSLTVTLRHLPPMNKMPVKVAGLAEQVRAAMGFATIGGETDVQVTLPVQVQ